MNLIASGEYEVLVGLVCLSGFLWGLFTKPKKEIYVEVAKTKPLKPEDNPDIKSAIAGVMAWGHSKTAAKKAVVAAYEDGSSDLVQDALAKIEV